MSRPFSETAGRPIIGRCAMDTLEAGDRVRVTWESRRDGEANVAISEVSEVHVSPGVTTARLPAGDPGDPADDVQLWVAMDGDGCLDVYVHRGESQRRRTWGVISRGPVTLHRL